MFQKKSKLKSPNKKNFFGVEVNKMKNYYKSVYNLNLIVRLSWGPEPEKRCDVIF